MKKRLCTLLLVFAIMLTSMTSVFAAQNNVTVDTSALDKQIATLEGEINKIQSQINVLGKNGNVIMGNVISTDPYIISGGGVGDQCTNALLAGVKYFVVKNPQAGQLTAGYFYNGTHKYVGTTTIVIGKTKHTAYVFDEFKDLDKWRALGEQVEAKKKELDKLTTKKAQMIYQANHPVVEEVVPPSFADTIDQNLTTKGNMYTFNDNVIGGKYEYPKSWGKPVDESEKDYHEVVFMNETSRVIINYTAIAVEDYKESVRDRFWDTYENIPLTSTNSGIETMCVKKTITGGNLSILGTNGAVITIIWETPEYFYETQYNLDFQDEKETMDAQVLQMVKTFKLTEAAG